MSPIQRVIFQMIKETKNKQKVTAAVNKIQFNKHIVL